MERRWKQKMSTDAISVDAFVIAARCGCLVYCYCTLWHALVELNIQIKCTPFALGRLWNGFFFSVTLKATFLIATLYKTDSVYRIACKPLQMLRCWYTVQADGDVEIDTPLRSMGFVNVFSPHFSCSYSHLEGVLLANTACRICQIICALIFEWRKCAATQPSVCICKWDTVKRCHSSSELARYGNFAMWNEIVPY